MKKKYLILGLAVLALVILGVWAVPVFADGASAANPPAQTAQKPNKVQMMVRLFLVQDEAKVDAFLAKAVTAGKITADQATTVKTAWTDHHAQFKAGSPLVKLLQAKDQTKVQAALDKAVSNKKITQDQATKIMTLWQALHTN